MESYVQLGAEKFSLTEKKELILIIRYLEKKFLYYMQEKQTPHWCRVKVNMDIENSGSSVVITYALSHPFTGDLIEEFTFSIGESLGVRDPVSFARMMEQLLYISFSGILATHQDVKEYLRRSNAYKGSHTLSITEVFKKSELPSPEVSCYAQAYMTNNLCKKLDRFIDKQDFSVHYRYGKSVYSVLYFYNEEGYSAFLVRVAKHLATHDVFIQLLPNQSFWEKYLFFTDQTSQFHKVLNKPPVITL